MLCQSTLIWGVLNASPSAFSGNASVEQEVSLSDVQYTLTYVNTRASGVDASIFAMTPWHLKLIIMYLKNGDEWMGSTLAN